MNARNGFAIASSLVVLLALASTVMQAKKDETGAMTQYDRTTREMAEGIADDRSGSMAVTTAAITTPPGVTVRVLAKGAPFHGPDGITFDSQDRLFIASSFGNEIVVMDPQSGRILERMGPEAPLVEVPSHPTFGPKDTPYEGYLYWTSTSTGYVNRLAPDGTLVRQFLAIGANAIAFTDDGRLFVALGFWGDGLYEVDPDLEGDPSPIIVPTPGNPLPLGFLGGMAFGADGYLYGGTWIQGKVVRIDIDTGDIEVIASGSGLVSLSAAKFDSTGNFYVADNVSGRVSRVDIETGELYLVASGLEGLDDIAFDSRDRLFVSNLGDGSIQQLIPSGTRTVSKGGMIMPGGLVVKASPDGGESVFVADVYSLREFNGVTGAQESVQRSKALVPGGMMGPTTVALDGDNFVFGSFLSFLEAVQVWDPEAGAQLEYYNDFGIPLNAIRFQGDLVVADLEGMQVVRQTPSGRITLANFMNGIYVPMGLAATDDDLWVSDWATGCVLQLYENGVHLTLPRVVACDLSSPKGLAVESDGKLLVVESGAGRLSRIDPTKGSVEVVAAGLEIGYLFLASAPMIFFNGVAVGPSGAIYVTGDKANVLYRIDDHR